MSYSVMDESLWCEKTSSSFHHPSLPVCIIEYAWTNRLMEVLQVLGPPLWLEGDRSSLTLKDPCSIRVTAAESWMVIRSRDIEHFEQVMEFLDVTYTLLPQLVTPIKHMKIMFGLKTLVIMWMLRDDQSIDSITDKVVKFFPDSLPQYQRSSHRHMEMMQKAQRDFRNFAQLLTRNPEMRTNYTKNLMKEQYGEGYIMKLEERLLHYLDVLNKALPQPTYIDQVLNQSGPLKGREELLQQLFNCNSASPATALKKLLRCAMADHKSTEMCTQQKGAQADGPMFGPHSVALRRSLEEPEEDWLSQASSQSFWLHRDKSLEKQVTLLKKKCVLDQTDKHPCMLKEQCARTTEIGLVAEGKKAEDDLTEHLCSRHGKRMKSILQECSEELRSHNGETSLIQVECTPVSPFVQSPPQRLTSASPLHDSSSTNISLSSQPESLSCLFMDEERQVDHSQPMVFSQICPAQEDSSSCFPGQKSDIALTLQVSPSPQCSAWLVTPSLPCSVQPSLSQTSSSSTNISPFPENKFTQESSSTEQEYSQGLSFKKMSPESSYNQPSSSSSLAPVTILTPSQNNAQVSLDSHVILEPSSALNSKPRLSLESQAFLLVCKWLQPRVKLHRLSQQECYQAILPNRAPEQSSEAEEEDEDEKDASFDVNILYSDSESDTQDSEDSDYVPSKRCRYR